MENKIPLEEYRKTRYTIQEYLETEHASEAEYKFFLQEPAVDYNKKRYTIEEYLEMERASTVKHEYYQGEIFAMAGASDRHNWMFTNIFGELCIQLKGNPCRPNGSDMRMHIPENTLYTYPDIAIYCGDTDEKDNPEEDTITEPTIIIEILSPSTRAYDLGTKFNLYKDIPTLKEYILIDTESIEVKAWRINAHNQWHPEEYKTLHKSVQIPTVGISLSMQDIYRGTRLAKLVS
jgi:Uma2 family endonuclease